MKRVVLSTMTAVAMSTFAFAGGDIAPVEPVVEVPEVVSTPGSFYVGLGYSYVDMNIGAHGEVPEDDATANSVLLLAGYNFNEYIGIEGRYTANVGDISYDLGNDASDDMTNIGGYLKLMYPVEQLNVYALLGYGKVTYDNGIQSASESGFQWGIGANYALTDNVDVFVDYTRLYDGTSFGYHWVSADITVDAVSVGVTYTF